MRLTKEQALELIRNADLKELGKMATARKKELHPDGITTFVVDRNINYTNVCWVDCKFCAFYRHGKDEDAYVLTFEEIDQKIDELLERYKDLVAQNESLRQEVVKAKALAEAKNVQIAKLEQDLIHKNVDTDDLFSKIEAVLGK